MNNSTHTARRALLFFALMLSAATAARAQDPVKVDPENYKLLQQTPTVRILEYKDTPGTKGPKHSHPNYYAIVISDATRQFTDAKPGDTTQCTGASVTVQLTAGEVIKKGPVTHCEANVGSTNTHLIVVEIKDVPKTTTSRPGGKRRR